MLATFVPPFPCHRSVLHSAPHCRATLDAVRRTSPRLQQDDDRTSADDVLHPCAQDGKMGRWAGVHGRTPPSLLVMDAPEPADKNARVDARPAPHFRSLTLAHQPRTNREGLHSLHNSTHLQQHHRKNKQAVTEHMYVLMSVDIPPPEVTGHPLHGCSHPYRTGRAELNRAAREAYTGRLEAQGITLRNLVVGSGTERLYPPPCARVRPKKRADQ